MAAVRAAHGKRLVWMLEADIVQCFDRIPHGRLLAELAIWVEREEVLGLTARWVHGLVKAGRGSAQGMLRERSLELLARRTGIVPPASPALGWGADACEYCLSAGYVPLATGGRARPAA